MQKGATNKWGGGSFVILRVMNFRNQLNTLVTSGAPLSGDWCNDLTRIILFVIKSESITITSLI